MYLVDTVMRSQSTSRTAITRQHLEHTGWKSGFDNQFSKFLFDRWRLASGAGRTQVYRRTNALKLVHSDGLRITQQPTANAGATFQAIIKRG